MKGKPSAPVVSRARRIKVAADTVSRLEQRLATLSQTNQPMADLTSLRMRLDRARLHLRNLQAEEAEAKAHAETVKGRAGCGNTDRLAVMVEKYGAMTAWHLQVAEALRESEARALAAGQASGALSGQAGDGLGNVVAFVSHEGKPVELGEESYGAVGVPGVAASGGGRWGRAPVAGAGRQAPPVSATFRAKAVKTVRRGGDGGMADVADALRREDRALAAFILAAAEAAGGGWKGLVVAWCCFRIIRRNDSADALIKNVFHVRKAKGARWLQTSMMAGLEACAPELGFR